ANPKWKELYGSLLDDLNSAYAEFKPYSFARDYQTEVIPRIELFVIASQLNTLVNAKDRNGEKGLNDTLQSVKEKLSDLYKEYNPEVDKKLFAVLMEMYVKNNDKNLLAPELLDWVNKANGNFEKLADMIYESTDIEDATKTLAKLDNNAKELAEEHRKDKVKELLLAINNAYSKNVAAKLNPLQARINQLQRTYMQAQMDVFTDKKFYPDANSTMRVAYGKVNGYEARDAVKYDYYTYLDGVMEKYVPGDYEFDLPQKLIDLHESKNYGRYAAANGKLPVCFIATNHTTGGNSGSPVLDAYGNLIGINFDRVWEGTMSDLNYDPSICRNIMVDIRYVLFIIDKFAGASHLVQEMKLVYPKQRNPKV
ncbi:MAG TPA: S46 family peptidase, partial [Flavisolibacter sp.]|nr:S46 family peptidase [Flavisolibacter sp.]